MAYCTLGLPLISTTPPPLAFEEKLSDSITASFVLFYRRLIVLPLGCVVIRWDGTVHDTLFILMNEAATLDSERVYRFFMLHLFCSGFNFPESFPTNLEN